MKKIIIASISIVATVGCMKQQSSPAIISSSDQATSAIGCESQQLQSKVFDSMYEYLDQENATPDLEQLKSEMSQKIDQIALNQDIQDTETLEKFKTEFNKIFDILINDSTQTKNVASIKEHIQLLIEMEMQDQSTQENIQLNNKLASQFSKVSALSQSLSLKCDNSAAATAPTTPTTTIATPATKRMIAGLNNVFTTAYQSCNVLKVPHITASSPDVDGIERYADHSDGIGGKRRIYDLAAVQRSHPYIKVAGNKTSSSCFNVYQNPLIYDYGGAPKIESGNKLNLFQNGGSGDRVLGIDCSALVASAAAVGGLRYKPGVDNKAIFVRHASYKFIDATASNFTCYKNITLTKTETLLPGDIAAVKGHVVMIEKVGADPFGVKKVPNLAGCATMNPRNFDFLVTQSSAAKNGIGIDKYLGADYISRAENSKMVALFMSMAKSSCEAYFKNTSIKPKSTEHGIIRHKGTPECLAPQKVEMVGQACVSSCQL